MTKFDTKDVIPDGAYDTTFNGCTDTHHEKWGPGRLWSWKITRGKYTGEEVFRTTKPVATPKNSAGNFLKTLTGLSWDDAKAADPDDYVGEKCSCIVKTGEGGSPRVDTFIVIRDADAKEDAAA